MKLLGTPIKLNKTHWSIIGLIGTIVLIAAFALLLTLTSLSQEGENEPSSEPTHDSSEAMASNGAMPPPPPDKSRPSSIDSALLFDAQALSNQDKDARYTKAINTFYYYSYLQNITDENGAPNSTKDDFLTILEHRMIDVYHAIYIRLFGSMEFNLYHLFIPVSLIIVHVCSIIWEEPFDLESAQKEDEEQKRLKRIYNNNNNNNRAPLGPEDPRSVSISHPPVSSPPAGSIKDSKVESPSPPISEPVLVLALVIIPLFSVPVNQFYVHIGIRHNQQKSPNVSVLETYSGLFNERLPVILIYSFLVASYVADEWAKCNLHEKYAGNKLLLVSILFATTFYILRRFIRNMPDMIGSIGTIVVYVVFMFSWVCYSRMSAKKASLAIEIAPLDTLPLLPSPKPAVAGLPTKPPTGTFNHWVWKMDAFVVWLSKPIRKIPRVPKIFALLPITLIAIAIYSGASGKGFGSVLASVLLFAITYLKGDFIFGNGMSMAGKWASNLFKKGAQFNDAHQAYRLTEPFYFPAITAVTNATFWQIFYASSAFASHPGLLATDKDTQFKPEPLNSTAIEHPSLNVAQDLFDPSQFFSSAVDTVGFDAWFANGLFKCIHKLAKFNGYQYLFGLLLPAAIFFSSIWSLYRSVNDDSRSLLDKLQCLKSILFIPAFRLTTTSPYFKRIPQTDEAYNFLLPIFIGGFAVVLQHFIVQVEMFFSSDNEKNPKVFAQRAFANIFPVHQLFASILAHTITEPLTKLKYKSELYFVKSPTLHSIDPSAINKFYNLATGLKPPLYRIELAFILLLLRRALVHGFSKLFNFLPWFGSIPIFVFSLFAISVIYTNFIGHIGGMFDVVQPHIAVLGTLAVIIGSAYSPTIMTVAPSSSSKSLGSITICANAVLNFLWTIWKFLRYDLDFLDDGIWSFFIHFAKDPMIKTALTWNGISLSFLSLKIKRNIRDGCGFDEFEAQHKPKPERDQVEPS